MSWLSSLETLWPTLNITRGNSLIKLNCIDITRVKMQIFRNLLTNKELDFVNSVLRQERWGFGYISNDPEKPIWNFDKASGKEVAELITSKLQLQYTLLDWHINGQTPQQQTAIHNDSVKGATLAFVFFPNDWRYEWGGRLHILEKTSTIITPEKNLGILFDANILHYAEAPVVNKLRVSIGLKLK
jgi:hypothetical protein